MAVSTGDERDDYDLVDLVGGSLLLTKPDLPHEGHQVVEEILLDDLLVIPAGHGAEVYVEFLAG